MIAERDDVPRAGLGGAIVTHVARGFGTRRWREASRLAVQAIESYNARVHRRPGDAWLAQDVGRIRRVWRGLLRREDPLLSRVFDRLAGGPPDVADEVIPESVIFLRLSVAAGVLAGGVPDDVHAALDRFATWLGLAWEASAGTLSEAGTRGALRAIGLDTLGEPRAEAQRALAALPDGAPTEALGSLLAEAPRLASPRRDPTEHRPLLAPLVAARTGDDVEAALGAIVTTESRSLTRASAYLQHQGGKRVRARMVLAAAEACGGHRDRALPVAGVVEWLHQASLVLDDIVDEAHVRRGGPTLHVATSTPFAVGVAVFLLSRLHLAMRPLGARVRESILDTATALLDGQRLELRHTGDAALATTRYFKIIESKTARLFASAAALGGLVAHASRGQLRALNRYGREAGLAFQIVDDLLDYAGDEGEFGKTLGTDLRAKKVTLPLLALRERMGPALSIDAVLASGDLPWVQARMHEYGIADLCLSRARRHLGAAEEAAASLPRDSGRAHLVELARSMVERRK
jgi:octaprenyl-diphosphate synthase